MEEIYKIDIKDTKYWCVGRKNGYNCLVETDKPCHLYVKKADIISDKMLCNYKSLIPNYVDGLRIREYEDFVVIEPSGIKVPKSNFTLVKKPLTVKDRSDAINPIYLTKYTYICNLINEGEKHEYISPTELGEYDSYLMAQRDNNENPLFISKFEFLYMFIYVCGVYHQKVIDKKLLRDIISDNEEKRKYFPLLWNIKSYLLEDAYNLLEYIGVIYPDLEDDNLVYIDKYTIFEPIIKNREDYLSIISELTGLYIREMKEKERKNGK